jgi:hypothetical protein
MYGRNRLFRTDTFGFLIPIRWHQRLPCVETILYQRDTNKISETNLCISLDTKLGVYRGRQVGSTAIRQHFEFRRSKCLRSFSICSLTGNQIVVPGG